MSSAFKTIDDYLLTHNPEVREQLEIIRGAVHSCVPEAQEVISYSMPAFKYKGRVLVYFAGFKRHCSLFPAGSKVLETMSDELSAYRTAKGTLQFQYGKKLPLTLIKKIIRARAKENAELARTKEQLKSNKK